MIGCECSGAVAFTSLICRNLLQSHCECQHVERLPYSSMHFPPLLAAGARVALLAPAGPIRDTDLERAEANARRFGWEPVVATNALAADGFLAGNDEQRARDLNDAIADKKIDAIWCLRGGYGAIRILESIAYQTLTRQPQALIGYSDVP